MRGKSGATGPRCAEIDGDRLAHDALEQRGLVLEVEIDRSLRQAGAFSDIVEPGRGEALLDEQRQRRVEDLAGALSGGTALFHGLHITNLLVS
jgi:hypothetical protein